MVRGAFLPPIFTLCPGSQEFHLTTGEWRICEQGAQRTELELVAEIPKMCLVKPGEGSSTIAAHLCRPWSAKDLDSPLELDGGADTSFIVWQWCPLKDCSIDGIGSVTLPVETWLPYPEDVSAAIERSFKAHRETVTVEMEQRLFSVTLTIGSTFAVQRDVENREERVVRRVLVTRGELRDMISPLGLPPP